MKLSASLSRIVFDEVETIAKKSLDAAVRGDRKALGRVHDATRLLEALAPQCADKEFPQ